MTEQGSAAMHRIEVDDDVYAELERHARGFERPNDVLRRLVLKDTAPLAQTDPLSARRGRLLPLIEGGLVEPGDGLRHEQPRKGNLYEATVDALGGITTRLGLYLAPSPALVDLVGGQIDGWANWVHVPSGKTLRQLRLQLEQRNAVPAPG